MAQYLILAYAGRTKGGRDSLDGTATAFPLHPGSEAHPDVADAGRSRIGLRSPDSASGSLGMAAPRDPGSPSEAGSPHLQVSTTSLSPCHHLDVLSRHLGQLQVYNEVGISDLVRHLFSMRRALAWHAAGIEMYLAI